MGVTWLTIGFMGKCFYHCFVIIHALSAPLILGMDLMLHASVSINVPSRTVVLADGHPILGEDEYNICTVNEFNGDGLMWLEVPLMALSDKVDCAVWRLKKKTAVDPFVKIWKPV